MIRQFLYGQRFTRENFDYTSDCFWLPDTFGYNGNIPQIMKGCGIRYFLTQKIYGNEVNTVPYDSFKWKGIDGSEVVCHYSCSGVAGDCEKVHAVVDTIKHKDSCDMHLLAYGFGDGGGGPSYGIVEAARRASHCAALPEAAYVSVSQFMKRLVETYADDLPVFDGELYYEYHRGTLTQMHDVKKKNRQAEFAVRNMEYFLVHRGETYSEEAVEHIKNVLLNQFHDILPGTSVKSVYDVANLEMDENIRYFTDRTRNLIDAYTDADPQRISVFNTLSFKPALRNDLSNNDIGILLQLTSVTKVFNVSINTDLPLPPSP
jgi:alpha-mannosidase